MIRVLIAAGSPVARAGLESLVRANPSMTVVADAGEADVLLAHNEAPLNPGGRLPVVLLSGAAWTSEALRSGIHAILPAAAAPHEIVAAVEAVAAGLVVMAPASADVLLHGIHEHAPDQPLTARELEVLAMLAEGLGNKAIAWRLGVSGHTVKFHISSIFTKLDVSTRTEAVTAGYRRGLILL